MCSIMHVTSGAEKKDNEAKRREKGATVGMLTWRAVKEDPSEEAAGEQGPGVWHEGARR